MTEPAPQIAHQQYNLSDQRTAFAALEAERCRMGMSILDMEHRSGVSATSVYTWRKCARSPTLFNVVTIAETFGFDVIMRRKKTAE